MVGGLGGAGSGDLQVLDDATGEFLGVVDTVADCAGTPCEIGRISSSVFDPIAQRLITGIGNSSFCAGCVLSINLTTGIATVLWNNAILQAAV